MSQNMSSAAVVNATFSKLTDDSHKISYLIFFENGIDVAKFVVCCSCDGSQFVPSSPDTIISDLSEALL